MIGCPLIFGIEDFTQFTALRAKIIGNFHRDAISAVPCSFEGLVASASEMFGI